MSYEKFIEALKKNDKYSIHDPETGKREYWQSRHEWRTSHTIEQYWRTGGVDGGNCWNDGGHYALDADPTPTSWPEFDKIIMEYWPDITFMQYRAMIQPLIVYHERTEYEYYGNNTKYGHNVVNLKQLFTLLKENGKL